MASRRWTGFLAIRREADAVTADEEDARLVGRSAGAAPPTGICPGGGVGGGGGGRRSMARSWSADGLSRGRCCSSAAQAARISGETCLGSAGGLPRMMRITSAGRVSAVKG
eukprot:scaffold1957_cov110-Isochrysis_galbana.AAC.19